MDLYASAGQKLKFILFPFINVLTEECLDFRYGDYGGMMESGTTAMEAITALLVQLLHNNLAETNLSHLFH